MKGVAGPQTNCNHQLTVSVRLAEWHQVLFAQVRLLVGTDNSRSVARCDVLQRHITISKRIKSNAPPYKLNLQYTMSKISLRVYNHQTVIQDITSLESYYDSIFNIQMMRTKITIIKLSLNTQDFSSITLLTQSMKYPERHFR